MQSLALIAVDGMSSTAHDRVPTLTEEVEWSASETRRSPVQMASALADCISRPGAVQVQATELSADLLFELEGRVGVALEARLRESLAPALARVADALIREAKQELAATMRELVEEAVTRAIERHTHL